MPIDFSKYGKIMGSSTPVQGTVPTPEEIDFSKYGTPAQSPLIPADDARMTEGLNKTFGISQAPKQEEMGVGDYVGKFLGDPAKGLVDTYKQYPGKIKDNIVAGAQDMQNGNVLKGIAKTGLRVAGDTAGAVFAAPGALIQSGMSMAKEVAPPLAKAMGAGIDKAADVISDNPVVQEFAMKHPNAAEDFNRALNLILGKAERTPLKPTRVAGELKALPETIKNDAMSIGRDAKQTVTDAGAKVKETIVDPLVRKMNERSQVNLEKKILYEYQKGVKPTILGKQTVGKADNYNKKVVSAVDAIVENSPNLKYTLDDGIVETGRTPQTLNEFSQSITQTKKAIFDKYDNMAKEAGESGAVVETKPIALELDPVINNKALKITNPEAIKYAENLQYRLSREGALDAKTTQEVIEAYNRSLEAYYRNPSYETATKAGIDALIANKFRERLDTVIEKTSGDGYQELKNQYGALKTIEKDVVKRDLVDARKNIKGLVDYSDVLSGAELVIGLTTMSPASFIRGAAIKGISSYIKHLNSPNRAIRSMFDEASKKITPDPASKPGQTGKPQTKSPVSPPEGIAPTESKVLKPSVNNTTLKTNSTGDVIPTSFEPRPGESPSQQMSRLKNDNPTLYPRDNKGKSSKKDSPTMGKIEPELEPLAKEVQKHNSAQEFILDVLDDSKLLRVDPDGTPVISYKQSSFTTKYNMSKELEKLSEPYKDQVTKENAREISEKILTDFYNRVKDGSESKKLDQEYQSFSRDTSLKDADAKVQDDSIRSYINNKEKLLSDYLKTNKKVVNTDEARKFFKDTGYEGTNARAVQEPSSALAKDAWRSLLKSSKEPEALILAGGSGTGKTSVVKDLFPEDLKNSGAILDGNLSSAKSATARIQEALDAGKRPKILYVYRDPVDAWVNGVVKRMKHNVSEGGRIVPLSVFADNHKGSYDVVKGLLNNEGSGKLFDVKMVDNSLGEKKAALLSQEKFDSIKYTDDLVEKLTEATNKLYAEDEITKTQLDELLK